MPHQLDKLLRPESIAVLGASEKPKTPRYRLFKHLVKGDFEGRIFAVNPKYQTVQGVPCYANVRHLPIVPDLVVMALARPRVLANLEICGELGVKAVLLMTSSNRQAGQPENEFDQGVREIAQKYGMRILGAGSFGLFNPHIDLNISMFPKMLNEGGIAFISESRAVSAATAEWAYYERFGFSHFVSIGSMLDVQYHELIDYFSQDFHTNCILIYMESLREARKFLSAAREFTRTKPIIVYKAGKSGKGAEIIYANRGEPAGDSAVYSAAFRRVGIIEVDSLLQLFNSAEAFGKQTNPTNNRLAIITNAAAWGTIATDYLLKNGGQLAQFSELTHRKIDAIIPPERQSGNPIDLHFVGDIGNYKKAVLSCLHDENTDGILVIYSPDPSIDHADLAKNLVKIARFAEKTVLVCWVDRVDYTGGKQILENGGLPVYHFAENAVNIFLKMADYSRNIDLLYETPSSVPEDFVRNIAGARSFLQEIRNEGRTQLSELETKRLLHFYGILSPFHALVHTAEEAVKVAKKIGYPVVLKLSGPYLDARTEVKGILLNLQSAAAVRGAFGWLEDLIEEHQLHDQIDGILVEELFQKDYDLFLSAEKHPVFGPAIKFGLGGLTFDLYDDITCGLPPLNMALAKRMIEQTKIYRALQGYGGSKTVSIEAIQVLLYKFSYLVMDFPQIKNISINPFAMNEKIGMVLNARAVLEEENLLYSDNFSHLAISPYPEEYVSKMKLRNGGKITLRPIRAEDETLEKELMENMSEESMYFRFFTSGLKLTHQMLSRFTNIDYDREVAIVAEYKDETGKHLAGVVRLVIEGNEGEYAIAIRDDWHGKGLGTKMTDYIIDIAKSRNLDRIHASLLKANRPMKALFEKKGFRIWLIDEETFGAELFLRDEL